MFRHSDLFIEMMLKSRSFNKSLKQSVSVGDYLYVTSAKTVVLCLGTDKEGYYETKEVLRKGNVVLIGDEIMHIHPKQEFYWLPTIGEMLELLCAPDDYFTMEEILKSCFKPEYGIGLLESLFALFILFSNNMVWNIPERIFVTLEEAKVEMHK